MANTKKSPNFNCHPYIITIAHIYTQKLANKRVRENKLS